MPQEIRNSNSIWEAGASAAKSTGEWRSTKRSGFGPKRQNPPALGLGRRRSPAQPTPPSPARARPSGSPAGKPRTRPSRVAQTLVEQIDVIASLGQMRDERSPDVMEAKLFGLLRVAVADASPEAGEKVMEAVYGLPSVLGKTSSPFSGSRLEDRHHWFRQRQFVGFAGFRAAR